MSPLCFIETPFEAKFGVPRQSLLIQEAKGRMVFPKNDFFLEAFRGLNEFSHLWLIFDFHLIEDQNISALIRPPRFKGKRKLGVFATRSPHRPNRLGLSVVKFHQLVVGEKNIILEVTGVDMVSGTPIFDIKPYLPYVDCVTEATGQSFQTKPEVKSVQWNCEHPSDPEFTMLIEKVVGHDPRPAHQVMDDHEFGLTLNGVNIRFFEKENIFYITSLL